MGSKSADGILKEASSLIWAARQKQKPQSHDLVLFRKKFASSIGKLKETDKWTRGPWRKPAFTALRSISRVKAVTRHHDHVVIVVVVVSFMMFASSKHHALCCSRGGGF
jgi:hypothetical protein